MRWNDISIPRHEHQVHALYCDIDDRIIAGFEASTRYGFKALLTQIHPIDTSYAMNGGDVTYLQEGGGGSSQSSYLFVNANFGFGKFTTHAIIADKEIADD